MFIVNIMKFDVEPSSYYKALEQWPLLIGPYPRLCFTVVLLDSGKNDDAQTWNKAVLADKYISKFYSPIQIIRCQ